jgi:hypothetical protein
MFLLCSSANQHSASLILHFLIFDRLKAIGSPLIVSSHRRRNFQIQRLHHFQDGRKFWVAFGTQRFVEALAREAGFARHFGHAFGAGHRAECMGNEFGSTFVTLPPSGEGGALAPDAGRSAARTTHTQSLT